MGIGWFRTWGGGMVVTCGLDHTLLGGLDSAEQFHQDLQTEIEYGLMGRIGMLPARLVGYGEEWRGDECVSLGRGRRPPISGVRGGDGAAPPCGGHSRWLCSSHR